MKKITFLLLLLICTIVFLSKANIAQAQECVPLGDPGCSNGTHVLRCHQDPAGPTTHCCSSNVNACQTPTAASPLPTPAATSPLPTPARATPLATPGRASPLATPGALPGGSGIFGTVNNPFIAGPLGPGGGLVSLLNSLLQLIFVVGGIFAFVKIVLAGIKFINAGGDAKQIEQAWQSIWQSLLGVVIIISSLAIAGLMGQILFGDATAILKPTIYVPTVTP